MSQVVRDMLQSVVADPDMVDEIAKRMNTTGDEVRALARSWLGLSPEHQRDAVRTLYAPKWQATRYERTDRNLGYYVWHDCGKWYIRDNFRQHHYMRRVGDGYRFDVFASHDKDAFAFPTAQAAMDVLDSLYEGAMPEALLAQVEAEPVKLTLEEAVKDAAQRMPADASAISVCSKVVVVTFKSAAEAASFTRFVGKFLFVEHDISADVTQCGTGAIEVHVTA